MFGEIHEALIDNRHTADFGADLQDLPQNCFLRDQSAWIVGIGEKEQLRAIDLCFEMIRVEAKVIRDRSCHIADFAVFGTQRTLILFKIRRREQRASRPKRPADPENQILSTQAGQEAYQNHPHSKVLTDSQSEKG